MERDFNFVNKIKTKLAKVVLFNTHFYVQHRSTWSM